MFHQNQHQHQSIQEYVYEDVTDVVSSTLILLIITQLLLSSLMINEYRSNDITDSDFNEII